MIRINQLALAADHKPEAIKKKAAKLLRVNEDAIKEIRLVRRSIDARKKDQPLFSYIVDVELSEKKKEAQTVKKAANANIRLEKEECYRYPDFGEELLMERPVIIGAGPAGLFAALSLAENGFEPLLLEQGDDVDTRAGKVETFWEKGADFLDIRSNVQFGEGGAGTFSDGKLNTLVKDVSGRNRQVLKIFAESGADSSILYDSKPHIGTDVLRDVVKTIRSRIIQAGGEIRFCTRVTDFIVENREIHGVVTECTAKDQNRPVGDFRAPGALPGIIKTHHVILAAGHSARDLFSILESRQVIMEPKPFAVGLRVQHPQKQINLSQYGREEEPLFGAAPYKVTAKTSSGRGVYSFCMCPGGYVVNASSENGRLAVNGMSNFDRNGENANSAVIVTVTPEDFPAAGPLGGVAFQRRLEEQAFLLGGGKIPVQLYGDFKAQRTSRAYGDVGPGFCGATEFADLRELMPEELNRSFIEGMEQFGRKIRGFDRPDAVLAGIESRTSSPVRIVRGENLESNIKGLFPCGEGAGYAGGITSAAMDGIKVAEELIRRYRPLKAPVSRK